MSKSNDDIRTEAAAAGVHLWRIAERLGINDGNISSKLRRELPETGKGQNPANHRHPQNGGQK